MSYTNSCRLCNNLVISTAVAFDATTNTLNITLPNIGFRNCEKVCILVAQEIPEATTINALVNIVIEGSTYPLVAFNCLQVTACQIKEGYVYPTRIITNQVTGSFKLLVDPKQVCQSTARLLPVEPVADGGGA